MATLKRDTPAAPEGVVPIPLDEVIDGPRPGRDDPARDRLWCQVRHEYFELEVGTEHDPRILLTLKAHQARAWKVKRRSWLAKHFRHDSRVEVY